MRPSNHGREVILSVSEAESQTTAHYVSHPSSSSTSSETSTTGSFLRHSSRISPWGQHSFYPQQFEKPKPPYELCDVEVDTNVWFRIPPRLKFVEKLGSGAYGIVAAFQDQVTGQTVAIKRIQNAFNDLIDGLRVLREIRILRQLHHPNVVR